MARLPKARYTREFKVHAVSMAKDEGLGIAETARRLSISSKTLANWVKLAQEGQDFAKQSTVSDSQYCSHAYQENIVRYRMACSMSRKGNCYDNAPMESFWGLLKTELIHRRCYGSHAEAIRDITEYIEIFYNRQRRQAALGYLSPAAFARKIQEERPAKAA